MKRSALIGIIIASRRDSGVGQRELSRRLKKPANWLSRLESGNVKHIDAIDLIELADQLGVRASRWVSALEKKNGK